MTLEDLLKEIRILVELKHPLEVLAKVRNTVRSLHTVPYYKGKDSSKYLEYTCLVSTSKALKLFEDDLNEWNLNRRTDQVSLEFHNELVYAFLYNLIKTLEEDLKYINKLKQDYQKKDRIKISNYLKNKITSFNPEKKEPV